MTVLRVIGWIWTLPNTLLGLLTFWIGGAQAHTPVGAAPGVLYGAPRSASSWITAWSRLFGFAGYTLGAVVVVARADMLVPQLVKHENHHVWQAMVLGPLFLPVYLLAAGLAALAGGDWHADNPFEAAARGRE